MLSLTRMHFEVAGCNTNIRDLQLPATASGVHKLAGGSFPCEVAAVFASDRVDLDPNRRRMLLAYMQNTGFFDRSCAKNLSVHLAFGLSWLC